MARVSPSGAGLRQFHVVTEPTRQLRQELTSIGLLSAQILAAAARVRDGEPLQPADRRVLEQAAMTFRGFAQRIRFVDSNGTVGNAPLTLLSTNVTGHLVTGDPPAEDPEELAEYFEELAAKLDQLRSQDGQPEVAAELYQQFLQIATRLRAAAGSSGHISTRQTSPRF